MAGLQFPLATSQKRLGEGKEVAREKNKTQNEKRNVATRTGKNEDR